MHVHFVEMRLIVVQMLFESTVEFRQLSVKGLLRLGVMLVRGRQMRFVRLTRVRRR